MYTPKNMAMDEHFAADFIHEFSFALLVSPTLEATHLPLLYRPEEGPKGTLYGHFARANPHWQNLNGQRVLTVFSGPHAYVSPTWYAAKPAVPTWNYAAVHCHGNLELLGDEQTHAVMDALVRRYEPQLLQNEQVMPAEFRQQLARGIVGFRILVDDIQGKEKLGQHRSTADQSTTYAALRESEHFDANRLAEYMRRRELGIGEG